MPDGLTAPAKEPLHQPSSHAAPRRLRASWFVVPVQMTLTIAAFGGAGALSGWLWYHLWTPPHGVVADHQWFLDPAEAGLRGDFPGTGWYVVVAVPAGLLLGAASAYLLDRSELATLAAVAVGSLLAGWLMLRVGLHLSPPDPDTLARTAKDGTELPGRLHVSRLPPKLSYPAGALLGLALVYLFTSRRGTWNGPSRREPVGRLRPSQP
jgi:hypothetical protein